jgi:hypothetical protein
MQAHCTCSRFVIGTAASDTFNMNAEECAVLGLEGDDTFNLSNSSQQGSRDGGAGNDFFAARTDFVPSATGSTVSGPIAAVGASGNVKDAAENAFASLGDISDAFGSLTLLPISSIENSTDGCSHGTHNRPGAAH